MIEKFSKVSAVAFWLFAVIAVPLTTFAQYDPRVQQQAPGGGGNTSGLGGVLKEFGGLVQGLIPIVIGLGVLVFLFGILRYVLASDDAGKSQGRTFMLWGIIALFVMVSVWGLVNILQQTLRLQNITPTAPGIPRAGQ